MKESKTAQLYNQNGEITKVSPSNGTDFKLDELQSLVGGMIETIYLNQKFILVVNEEGKFLSNCTYNYNATRVAMEHRAIFATDCICGNAILCETDMIK